jgi:hypothetical protein
LPHTRQQHRVAGTAIRISERRWILQQITLVDNDNDPRVIHFRHRCKAIHEEGVPVGLSRRTNHNDLVDICRNKSDAADLAGHAAS